MKKDTIWRKINFLNNAEISNTGVIKFNFKGKERIIERTKFSNSVTFGTKPFVKSYSVSSIVHEHFSQDEIPDDYKFKINNLNGEEWLEYPNNKNYLISNKGRIQARFTLLNPKTNRWGYKSIKICSKASNREHCLHKLVAETFIPNKNNKPQVNHINGIKTDNRVENLEWCTVKENVQHAYITGLKKGKKKVSEEKILKTLNSNKTINEMAIELGYTKGHINKLKRIYK
jgi:hypothetical protein